MKFGIHNSSWARLFRSGRGLRGGEGEGAVGGKSRLCLVLGHGSHDPDPPRGRARRAGPGRLDRPGGAGRRHQPHPSRHACTSVGYRNPAHLAKIAASVDLISRGRLTLGIGAGFFEDEYTQYGWEFPPRPATRIRQMEEAVRLILKMWTEKRTTFHGRYFHVEDAILEPKPVQKPRPPVMIAGGGEQMTLRAVARLADACNIVDGDVAEVRHKLAVLRGHCDAAGRDYDTIEKTRIQPWLLARDEAAVAAKRERLAALRTIARLCRHGVRGHRSDRAISGRRRRAADQCRSAERRGDP